MAPLEVNGSGVDDDGGVLEDCCVASGFPHPWKAAGNQWRNHHHVGWKGQDAEQDTVGGSTLGDH